MDELRKTKHGFKFRDAYQLGKKLWKYAALWQMSQRKVFV